MTDIKVGQWWRTRGGEIRKVIADTRDHGRENVFTLTVMDTDGDTEPHTSTGRYYAGDEDSSEDLVEHLSDCDGFDWTPKPADPYPHYYDSQNPGYAYLRRDSDTESELVRRDGRKQGKGKWFESDSDRNRLTESEALSRVERKCSITFRHFIVWNAGSPKYVVRIDDGNTPPKWEYFRDTGKTETFEVDE